ncbi:unnamed protein product, partial [Laminaria digitata]
MSGRSSRGRGRSRTQGGGGRSRAGSQSPGGTQRTRHRQHQSATARWSSAPPGLASDPGTGSVSSSSTSTGRTAADILSHPTAVSAESDFSLSEVFAGAVSPAGLAAAAAASSAADLFQSNPLPARTSLGAAPGGGGVGSAVGVPASLTPRARTTAGGFG